MAATNFHPVQPIMEAVETVGEKTPGLKPAPSALALTTTNKIYLELATKRKHLLKTQQKPNTEKNQKNPNL